MERTAVNLLYIARQTALREMRQWEGLMKGPGPILWDSLMISLCTSKSRTREEMIEPISKEVLGGLVTATSAAKTAVKLPVKVPFLIPSRSSEALFTYDMYKARIFYPFPPSLSYE